MTVVAFFGAPFTSFHTHDSLLTFFVCFFVLFHSCCSHARVFWKTLLHKFHISYSHTECDLFFAKRVDRNGRRVACQKLIIIIKIIFVWYQGYAIFYARIAFYVPYCCSLPISTNFSLLNY